MRTVIIASPVATQSGYGHHAREVINNLIEQKGKEWDIKLLSLPWGHTPFTYPLSQDLKNRIIPMPIQQQPDIWIQISVPNELQPVGKFNIGVTAGTEGDVCPTEWIEKINAMQILIVPSEFTKSVFVETAKRNNLDIVTNIQVVPEYFDETVYDNKNVVASISELDDISESFAFLTVGHWLQGQIGEDRKNISGVIHCFFNTFKNQKDQPALVLKTSGATYSVTDRSEIEDKIRQIQDLFPNDRLPNIYVLHGDLTDAEMNALYNHTKIKAMLSFTKAEGFGRPLLEFTAACKPIIAPHYSGQADFLKKEFICSLPGQLTEIHGSARNAFLIKEAKWFSLDYGYASKMLVDVKKNYKNWMALAKRQRYFSLSNFSKTAIAAKYSELIELIENKMANVPTQVQLQLPKLKKTEVTPTTAVSLPKLKKVEL